ncbi:MAG: hypothetical protein J6036_06865 [Clostridia bacterium]|nr:hypothetical protein [Clostridia bacterium]
MKKSEVKKVSEVKTILKRMAFYYLLLAINVVPLVGLLPDVFPTRNSSTVFLLILSVCLVLYYSHRVLPTAGLSAMMKALSYMALLMILLRGIKYSAFAEVGVLARHTWYFYYVPVLLLPLFFFCISLLVPPKKYAHSKRIWYCTLALTALLIILVLTNDFHQLVFAFKPGFVNWDNDYSHGLLFYVIMFWQYALYIAAIIILLIKCRISSSRKHAWLIMIPFAVGFVMNVLLITGKMPKINGVNVVAFPETLICTAAATLECCILLGLIPTNMDYGKLFRHFSISAQITDRKGNPVYVSSAASPLTKEQFSLQDGARVDEHTVLHKMEIPGGFGFWQDDMTGLDRLNEELADAKEELSQEAELTRLRNELKEKQKKLEQHMLLYDNIAKSVWSQSQTISQLAKSARLSTDRTQKEECRNRIILLGAYIKRYANLTLLSQDNDEIEVGELGLSVLEMLRYLNFCGIPGEFIQNAEGKVNAKAALAFFETFETLLETNYFCLHGVFVNLSVKESVIFKMTFENLEETLSEDAEKRLSDCCIKTEIQKEDSVTYICLALPKGGEKV